MFMQSTNTAKLCYLMKKTRKNIELSGSKKLIFAHTYMEADDCNGNVKKEWTIN